MDAERLVHEMRRLAVLAGEAILRIRNGEDFDIRLKGDESPVTRADLAADAIITRGLRDAFPAIPLVTEEQADTHDTAASRFIIVDPLDGTREFIGGRGEFTVNIALVEGGISRLGVVFAPAVGRLFYTQPDGRAVEETGPHDADHPGALRPLRVRVPDNRALLVVASKSHRDRATDAYIARYAVADMLPAGSSLKFCLVAAGEADFYPRLGRTMEWDTAAGHAVLAGAGGQVVRLPDHAPLVYGKQGYENPHFAALVPGVILK